MSIQAARAETAVQQIDFARNGPEMLNGSNVSLGSGISLFMFQFSISRTQNLNLFEQLPLALVPQ
jgi:hypothetical protein